jgi:hypothetical protein
MALLLVNQTHPQTYDPTLEEGHRKQLTIDNQVSMLRLLETGVLGTDV